MNNSVIDQGLGSGVVLAVCHTEKHGLGRHGLLLTASMASEQFDTLQGGSSAADISSSRVLLLMYNRVHAICCGRHVHS